MEAKQYVTKHMNGSLKKSKRKSEATWRQMKMETQIFKTYGTEQKQF